MFCTCRISSTRLTYPTSITSSARTDTNQFHKNVYINTQRRKRKGTAFTEATAGGTEATSALRSPALLSRAPTFRSPPATPLVSPEAVALIARGHLDLPRNGRGGRRRRIGREMPMEAGAIVALAWMERLAKVSRVRNWETVAHWPWLAARGGGFHCPPLSRVARRLWGELAQEGLWASYTFEWAS